MGSPMQRSQAMQRVLDRLRAMDRSVAWLARNLDPPITRQAITMWQRVPPKRATQVSILLGMLREEVCPSLPAQNTQVAVHQEA